MPLTPLHFGLLAPILCLFPGQASIVSFTLVNLWIDADFITAVMTGNPLPDHTIKHTLAGAMLIAALVSAVGVRSGPWVFGAFFGALTHVLLDGLVHPEMNPFYPRTGNPLYWGHMGLLSLILLPLMIWFILQIVSNSRDWVRKSWVAFRSGRS